MEQANQEIRRTAAASGVRLWQIAEKLGVVDATFSRQLRKEFPTEKRKRVLKIIRELEQERKKGAMGE